MANLTRSILQDVCTPIIRKDQGSDPKNIYPTAETNFLSNEAQNQAKLNSFSLTNKLVFKAWKVNRTTAEL